MKKVDYQKYFKDKKITVMGIGLLGRNVGDIKFLAENGADIIATDLKSETELKKSLRILKKFKNIDYTLDRHLVADFKNRDFILKGNGVPLENKYIDTAKNAKVPVHMSFALLMHILKTENINVTVIGITGSKGKSTTTALVESILKKSGKTYHVAGNVRGVANLPLLKKIKDGDIILAELDSWQLHGMHDVKISPNIAVFTNFFEDHLNYYTGSMKKYFHDKSAIFAYQNPDDVLITTNEAKLAIADYYKKPLRSKKIQAVFGKTLRDLDYNIFGRHNEKNISLAYNVGHVLGIDDATIFSALTEFQAIDGRFQFIKNVNGVDFYNDNNSTTPDSTIVSLQSLQKKYPENNIVLIGGGTDKDFNYGKLGRYIARNISFAILFSGSATDKIKSEFGPRFGRVIETMHMKTAVNIAAEKAEPGDVVILSPAAVSFGLFNNEYERNDQYVSCVKKIKQN
ncbi:MAG: UDP-N-acetylmuramoyl-L-alanine--D-glutamate ligase [Minisyncoccia bacterium]